LNRELHEYFISWYLSFELPGYAVGLDASRPWQMYWCTHAYVGLLGFSLDQSQRTRLISTLAKCRPLLKQGEISQPKAGFGGGPGQIMHLAPTYAGIMALATVLRTCEEWDAIMDRRALHDWILTLKQPDGSFVMHQGGEVDVR
jgi:protein farnesyltransferase subunit beta